MAKQKYKAGTFVWISKDMPKSMDHFEKDRPAMVMGTYASEYGPSQLDDFKSYSLLVRYNNGTWSTVSWYDEEQLSIITDKKQLSQYKKETGLKIVKEVNYRVKIKLDE